MNEKRPVLDLVPLARAGWVVTHRHLKAELIGELLQEVLPRPVAVLVAHALEALVDARDLGRRQDLGLATAAGVAVGGASCAGRATRGRCTSGVTVSDGFPGTTADSPSRSSLICSSSSRARRL